MKFKSSDLTWQEKLKLLRAKNRWNIEDLDGKLPKVTVSDGPNGLRVEKYGVHGTNIPAVGFPATVTLANTWSVDCAYEMGAALADECIERDVDILLAPGVNIKRTPLNGRNFEYYSEDPYLAGMMAKYYIKGLQDQGVGACIKHFAANNLEYDRFHQSSEVDERTLRELYYRPFELAMEAKPMTLMSSYNRINGVYASENKKGYDMLRGEFGFDGVIFSDWNAVRNRNAALNAGLDIEYPYNESNEKQFFADYQKGLVDEKAVDECCDRILKLVYDIESKRKGRAVKTTVTERIATAKKIATEGIVLLKNNGVLPIAESRTVSVAGIYAKPDIIKMVVGGGSSRVDWLEPTFDLPDALSAYVKRVDYESAFYNTTIRAEWQNCHAAVLNACKDDVAIVCCGTGAFVELEETDRTTIRLHEVQERCILDTARHNKNTVVIIFAGSAVDVSAFEREVAAIVYVGFAGMKTDEVLAQILTGKINPSGKLTETFARRQEDVPAVTVPFSTGVTRYQEGLDVGYRYFDKYGVDVAYPFGFGLSYSSFAYHDLQVAVDDERILVEYQITNHSGVDGKEISQIYVQDMLPVVYRPQKELKAFSKDFIAAGQTKTIKVELNKQHLAYYSTAKDSWTVDDGVYQIIVGPNVSDEALICKLLVEDGRIRLA